MIVTEEIIIIDTKSQDGHDIQTECRRFDDGTWCVKHTIDKSPFYVIYPDMPKEFLYAMFSGQYAGSAELRNKAAEIYVPRGFMVSGINTTHIEDIFQSTVPKNDVVVSAFPVQQELPIQLEPVICDTSLDPTDAPLEYEEEPSEEQFQFQDLRDRDLIEQSEDEDRMAYLDRMSSRIGAVVETKGYSQFQRIVGDSRMLGNRLIDVSIVYNMSFNQELHCGFTEKDFLRYVNNNIDRYDTNGVRYFHPEKRIRWWINNGFLSKVGVKPDGVGRPSILYMPTAKFVQVFTKSK